jgi:phospholipase C
MQACTKNVLRLLALTAGLGLMLHGLVEAQTFTNLHSFTGDDGAGPAAGLTLSGNTLYATADGGGSSGNGTVFRVNTDGTGFTNLHNFTATTYDGVTQSATNLDGAFPYAGLVLSGNTLYGTATAGGVRGNGTVFAVNTDGTGFTSLHSFTALSPFNGENGDGATPYASLVLSGNTLYGTAAFGGSSGSGYGTVFKLNTDGSGFTTLYSFASFYDGSHPLGGLILSGDTLYGTATKAGVSGVGTVFRINADGTGFANLHSFTGDDGSNPYASLVLSGNTLYGTAAFGGGSGSGNGTVFRVNTDGAGFTNLHSFMAGSYDSSAGVWTNSDGAKPHGSLVLSGNTLHGTAAFGGSSGNGTVFKVNTDGTCFAKLYGFSGGDGGAQPFGGLVLSSNTLYGTTSSGGSSGEGTVFSLSSGSATDLAATSLSWNTTNGGLDFAYTNQGGPSPCDTTAKLFWANGTNIANAFSNVAIYTTNIPAGFTGQATNHLPESYFQFPPTNATYVILVLDPTNLITEATKTNNTLALRNTFRHVVLVMMENRSFDHFLGWLPNAEGRQSGLTYTNAGGQAFPTWPLAPFFQGCGCASPDEGYVGGRVEFNNGACDGWLRAVTNDTFTIGYYVQTNLSFLGQAATNWTVCDHYFAAIMAETQPNRIYQHAAQTDSLTNRTVLESAGAAAGINSVSLPTIWDSLSQSNVRGHYYHAGSSFLSLWGPTRYYSITEGINQFYTDCENGALPAVSFVDPVFTSSAFSTVVFNDDTGGNDDHPHSDIRNGEVFLANIYSAIVSSPNWSSTVLIINFDEWGGFFDHVQPPKLGVSQVPPAEAILGNDGLLGFRVPCIVISPWSRRGYVTNEVFDHNSVLKLIENRWGLAPLTVRDANANDLADVLDFEHPNLTFPTGIGNVPAGPFGGLCGDLHSVEQPDGSVAITWDATCRKLLLQAAAFSYGPWSNVVTNGVSPYVVSAAQLHQLQQQFFRFQLIQ